MLKTPLCTISFLGLAALLLLGAPTNAQQQALKKNIAVMTLKNTSGITAGEAELITDRLSSELFNTGRVNVMERNQMNDILKEQGFQQSGVCTDEACLVEMGQMLGVQGLVSGSIGKLGSMYMLNMRVIDVTTGAITQVVSEDIRGDIEDLVDKLQGIAQRLIMGKDAPPPPAPVVKSEPAPKPVEKKPESEKPADTAEPIVAQPAQEQPATAAPVQTAQIDGDKNDRNRNRGGVRLSYTGYPGRALLITYLGGYPVMEDYDNEWADTLATSALHQVQAMFMIRAGNLFAITIGPSLAFSKSLVDIADTTFDDRYAILAVQPGFMFTKRFYPIKINAGLLVDFNMLVATYRKEFAGYYEMDTGTGPDDVDIAASLGIGGRFGAEVMLGTPNVGFSLDLTTRYLAFSTASGDGPLGDMVEADKDFTLRFPSVGIGAGFNFYF